MLNQQRLENLKSALQSAAINEQLRSSYQQIQEDKEFVNGVFAALFREQAAEEEIKKLEKRYSEYFERIRT